MRGIGLAGLVLTAVLLVAPTSVRAAASACPASPQELVDGGWVDRVTPGPAHDLVTFDHESGRPLATIGETEPIPTSPGYRVLRATAIAWDGARNRLHTLDTYTGSYQANALLGEAARRVAEAQVEDCHRALRGDERAARP